MKGKTTELGRNSIPITTKWGVLIVGALPINPSDPHADLMLMIERLTPEPFIDSVPNASNAPETLRKLIVIYFVIQVTQRIALMLSNNYKIQEVYHWFGSAIIYP